MRYSISFDTDGYVQNIFTTGNLRKDVYDLDLTKYDLTGDKKYAYKYENGVLVFDKKKYKEITDTKQVKNNKKESKELKEKLNETDYIVARAFEEVMMLDNPITWVADVIKIMSKYSKKYKDTIGNRKKWRERIEEIEN